MAPTLLSKLKDKSLFIEQCFVDGQWTPARSGKTFNVENPAINEVLGTCPECSKEDTETAIAAAAQAFESFRTTTARSRARLLRKWYNLMVENAEDLSLLITLENGKVLGEARGEVAYAASFLEWFSEEAPRTYGDTIPATNPGNQIVTIKEPVGVCALVTPWNFPAAMITRKVGAALAAGCTVVIKSPAETPFTANALAELAHRAGIPKGVINVITTDKNIVEVGHTLTSSPLVRKVSFTGSTNIGKLLMRQCAEITLKKISLELGGNAPFIVFDDADINAAVQGALISKFRSSGQTCVCANRIFVQDAVYDRFAEKLAAHVRDKFAVGDSLISSEVTHGPLIHDRAVAKVHEHVTDAVAKGARILAGGQKVPELGPNYFQPTVLAAMTCDMKLATEETFGPVAGLFRFKTEQEVVRLANNTDMGLAAYIFTKDNQKAWRTAKGLEVGMVGLNTGLISDAAAPLEVSSQVDSGGRGASTA